MKDSTRRWIDYQVATLCNWFLTQSIVQMVNNAPETLSMTHWFQWMCVGVGGVMSMAIVDRGFVDKSLSREDKDGLARDIEAMETRLKGLLKPIAAETNETKPNIPSTPIPAGPGG